MTTEPPAADFRIAYGSSPEQFGDLRLPGGAGPHPLVVAVHGGNWRAQYDLTHLGHLCAALTARGLATWSVEYRRIGQPGGGWPGTFLDVANAVDFVRTLAPRYRLDLARVVVVGHSAGGHLALWLAGRPRIPVGDSLWQADPLSVAGVVSLAGVSDLRRRWELQGTASMVPSLMGASPDEEPHRYQTVDAARLLPLGVRQILFHGALDTSVPYILAEEYRDRALATGNAVSLVGLPDVGHFELIDPRSPEFQTVAEAIEGLLR
jgi:acetyl esterase/lipase